MQHDSRQPVTRRSFVTAAGAGLAALPLAGTAGAAGPPDAAVGAASGWPDGGAQPAAPRAVGRPMPADTDLGDPPERRLGLAVVGLGNYALGQILPRIARTRHVRLAALVSGNRDKARAVAAAYGVPERSVYDYATFDRLRDDASVDAVYVILPVALHAEYTVRAARAGKHVLCEKPMAATSAECRQMIDACRAAGRRLMIGYRVYWEPHNVEAARLVAAGELGPVRQIVGQHGGPIDPTTPHGEWRIQRALAGGGSLWDIGIYSLNGARWFAGAEPVEVRATLRRPPGASVRGRTADVELGVDWSARFANGVVATATSAYDHSANRIQVLGEAGSLELSPATAYAGNELRVRGRAGERTPPAGQSERQFTGMLDELALAVRENREPRTPGAMGLQDVRVMEHIYEAARAGRAVAVAPPG
jgi:glucose-fructose oxidoreductase